MIGLIGPSNISLLNKINLIDEHGSSICPIPRNIDSEFLGREKEYPTASSPLNVYTPV
jgi:hypothetical protein